jgi:hypothetical protein
MAGDRSPWWRALDAAESSLAPRAERLARSGGFLDALGLAARAQAAARRRLEARSRQALHLLNLPAASDVTRLRRQVAALDHELRQVSMSLERALAAQHEREEDTSDADDPLGRGEQRAARARRGASARPPRRGTQRPAGP